MSDAPQKIEVVSGDGKELDISEVSTHLKIGKPKIKNDEEKNQKIIIPEEKKNTENTKKWEYRLYIYTLIIFID